MKNNRSNLSPRALQMAKYNSARMNLLFVLAITAINMIVALTGSGTYFLFSAFIPYFFVLDGMYSCGRMPDEWYEGAKSEYVFLDTSYFITMVAFAALILFLYFLFWLLSKNQKSVWLIAALVLFSVDTLGFIWLGGISADAILDILFHAWVLYYLISGIIAAKKLKSLPPDEVEAEAEQEGVDYFPETVNLKNGRRAQNAPANYFRGKESVGGKLHFYSDRIIFKSHSINIQTGNTTIKYIDMASTKEQKNLFLSNGLLVYTQDGTEHRFVINSRDEIKSFIDRKILAFKNQAQEVSLKETPAEEAVPAEENVCTPEGTDVTE